MRTPAMLALVFFAACAGPQQAASDASDGASDREADLNQQALIELRERGAAERAEDAAEEAARAVPDLPTQVLTPLTGPPALTPAGDLRRDAVVAFHARGPHALLGAVELIPAQREGSTIGFTIGAVHPSGTFVTAAGLETGDIVRRVNGRSVVLPDDFMEVFDALPEADELVLDVLRGAAEMELRWAIVDEN